MKKLFITLLISSYGLSGQAQPSAGVSTGGFLGRVAPHFSYAFTKKWEGRLGAGWTPGLRKDYYQWNGGIHWLPISSLKMGWVPLILGLDLIYSLDKNYFLKVPEKYPSNHYYPATALHGLLVFGTRWNVRSIHIDYFVSVPDIYLIAKYNNPDWNSSYCCSSGFGVSFLF